MVGPGLQDLEQVVVVGRTTSRPGHQDLLVVVVVV